MGKPTGFLEYTRELPVYRDPVERIRDWNEFHGHSDDAELSFQGLESDLHARDPLMSHEKR